MIGDLQGRRGSIVGADMRGNGHEVIASVPLANMFSYVNTVRSLSQGRATFSMSFSHYAALPKALQARVMAEAC